MQVFLEFCVPSIENKKVVQKQVFFFLSIFEVKLYADNFRWKFTRSKPTCSVDTHRQLHSHPPLNFLPQYSPLNWCMDWWSHWESFVLLVPKMPENPPWATIICHWHLMHFYCIPSKLFFTANRWFSKPNINPMHAGLAWLCHALVGNKSNKTQRPTYRLMVVTKHMLVHVQMIDKTWFRTVTNEILAFT